VQASLINRIIRKLTEDKTKQVQAYYGSGTVHRIASGLSANASAYIPVYLADGSTF